LTLDAEKSFAIDCTGTWPHRLHQLQQTLVQPLQLLATRAGGKKSWWFCC